MPNGGASTAAVRRLDRRRCVRRPVLASGEMIPVDLGPMESGLLLDISARGASVQGLKPLRPGVRISLKFRLPGSQVSVQPTYEVVWADPSGKVGLKFLYIADREQRLLDDWAASYLPPPEPKPEPSREPQPAPAPAAPTTMTLEQELARVVEQASGYTLADGAAIAVREQLGIVCRASCGNAPDIGVPLNPDSGLSGECIRTGAAVLCADALNDVRVDPVAARQLNLRSALIVPIKLDDAVHGLIEVLSSRADAFTPAHLKSLERLAEIVGFLMSPPLLAAPPTPPTTENTVQPQPATQHTDAEPMAEPAVASALEPPAPAVNEAAGIIELIEPELKPAPLVPHEESAAFATENVELPPEENVDAAAAASLASFDTETPRAFRVSIFAAVLVACGILLGAVWVLGPRWMSKPQPRPATATTTTTPKAPVLPDPTASPAPLIQVPIPSAPVPRSAGKKSAAPTETAADDVRTVTWIEGGRALAPKSPVNGSSEAPPAMVGVPAAADLPQIPSAPPSTPMRVLDATSPMLRVSGQAMLDRIISRPNPEYPDEARRAHISGIVTLVVIVGADGHVEMAAPVSGPPVLAVAAAKAVRQWRYRPYLLDGKPVRVETTVTVGFRRG